MATSIEDLTARAKSLVAERNYRDAVRACRRVLLSRPAAIDVRLLLGMALLSLERYDEARAEMLAALRRRPDLGAAHRLLGEAYLRDGQPEKAAEALEKSLALDPKDEVARDLLREVADEDKPRTETLDRWFDPEAVATVPTAPPAAWSDPDSPLPEPSEPTSDEPTSDTVPNGSEYRPRPRPSTPVASSPPPQSSRPAAYRGRTLQRPRPRWPVPRPVSGGPPNSTSERRSDRRPSVDWAGAPEAVGPDAKPRTGRPHPGLHDALEADETVATGIPERAPDKSNPDTPGAPEIDRTSRYPQAPPSGEFPWGDSTAVREDGSPDEFSPPAGGSAALALRPLEHLSGLPHPGPDSLEGPPHESRPLGGAATPPVPRGRVVSVQQPTGSAAAGVFWDRATAKLRGRGRLPLAMLFVALLIVGAGVTFGVSALLNARHAGQIDQAVRDASMTGRSAALKRALRLSEEHDGSTAADRALRARLLATVALELREDHREAAKQVLESIEPSDRALPDALIARSYIALAEGRNGDAMDAAFADVDEATSELWHARALAALAAGNWERAQDAATQAVSLSPEAPRHIALLGLATALAGDAALGAAVLNGEPSAAAVLGRVVGAGTDAVRSPAIRVARSRVLFESGRDPDQAAQDATAVLGELSADATPVERGWAHLILGRHHAAARDFERAKTSVGEAMGLAPLGDERFLLSVAEIFIQSGDSVGAGGALAALPSETTDAARRALATAEVALGRGDLAEVAAALETAPVSAQSAYLRGRLAEARGENRSARAAYREAREDRLQHGRATVRLAALHLREGDTGRAIALLSPLVERDPGDPDTVPLYVSALLRHGTGPSLRRAASATRASLRVRPDSPELRFADAEVAAAAGDYAAALDTLRAVVADHPARLEFRRHLARTAARAGEYGLARSSFERVLEADPADEPSAIGLAEISLREGALSEAEAAIEGVAAMGVAATEVAGLRSRVFVLRGDGERAVAPLQRLAQTAPTATVACSLGRVLFQAERHPEAMEAYRRALELDRGNPWALLGLAEARARGGTVARARRNLQAAQRRGATRRLGTYFEAYVHVAEARLALAAQDHDEARIKAQAALELGQGNAEAHLVLADIAAATGDDPTLHLRRATLGQAPPPRALGRLAVRVGRQEGCDLGRRYLQRAPAGADAPAVLSLMARCR